MKIIVDATPNTSYQVSWTTNSWSTSQSYAPGSILAVPGGASATFQIRITGGSNPGHINGYGVLHSPALPSNNTASGVVIDTSTYTGNLGATDNTVQKLADKVNTLATGGGYAIEVVSGVWEGKALQIGKEYMLLNIQNVGNARAYLPLLSSIAVGAGLIVNGLAMTPDYTGPGTNDWDTSAYVANVLRSGSDAMVFRSADGDSLLSSSSVTSVTIASPITHIPYSSTHAATSYRRVLFVKSSTNSWLAVQLNMFRTEAYS